MERDEHPAAHVLPERQLVVTNTEPGAQSLRAAAESSDGSFPAMSHSQATMTLV